MFLDLELGEMVYYCMPPAKNAGAVSICRVVKVEEKFITIETLDSFENKVSRSFDSLTGASFRDAGFIALLPAVVGGKV